MPLFTHISLSDNYLLFKNIVYFPSSVSDDFEKELFWILVFRVGNRRNTALFPLVLTSLNLNMYRILLKKRLYQILVETLYVEII